MFKKNDVVWIDESRLARAEDAPFGVALTHLTVAEAFELAGVGVDAPIACSDYGWWYSEDRVFDLAEHPEEWSEKGDKDFLPIDVNLSRTPVSDCWDALPGVVREAVEKKLEEGK